LKTAKSSGTAEKKNKAHFELDIGSGETWHYRLRAGKDLIICLDEKKE
jgi:hypothetical protein